ncbi:MAG: hypothetical protein CMM47_02465 [Rhodospirillaceae bacterium]|nr:hypothetical protein [Rhodospirillaceae bacterium]
MIKNAQVFLNFPNILPDTQTLENPLDACTDGIVLTVLLDGLSLYGHFIEKEKVDLATQQSDKSYQKPTRSLCVNLVSIFFISIGILSQRGSTY